MIKNLNDLKELCKSFPKEIPKKVTMECSVKQYNLINEFVAEITKNIPSIDTENKDNNLAVIINGITILFEENIEIKEPLHYYITL